MSADDLIIIGPKPKAVRTKLSLEDTIQALRDTADALEAGELETAEVE